MNNQYYKVIDSKGHVFLPAEIRKTANINPNDIVRICVYQQMIVLEKVLLPDVDMAQKLKKAIHEEAIPEDAVQCYVLAALEDMEKSKLVEVMECLKKYL